MASADRGQQEPGGGQQMPQDAFDPFPYDGGQEELSGSQLAVPDGPQVPGGGQQMPEHLTIGTKKAFEKNYPFPYEKTQIGSETIYVCTKGSQWARTSEVLVLRCVTGTWTAFDSAVSADGLTLQCPLHSQDGITGKPITLPVPMTRALRLIGRALFGLKPGCRAAMMQHA